MNDSNREPKRNRRPLRWPACISLVPLLIGGCDGCKAPGPRELVCQPTAYYEVVEPKQGAGAAPFSIERLGREVDGHQVPRKPTLLTFEEHNRVVVGFGDAVYGEVTVVYSPPEGLARDVDDPDFVYPMKRFSDGKSERVRFGFRSEMCRKPVKWGQYSNCNLTEDELFLVADMTCRWELIDPREWE